MRILASIARKGQKAKELPLLALHACIQGQPQAVALIDGHTHLFAIAT